MTDLQVDGIVRMDALKIDDVPKVPTHQNLHPCNAGNCNMLCVSTHVHRGRGLSNIRFRKLFRLGIESHYFGVLFRYAAEVIPHGLRRFG